MPARRKRHPQLVLHDGEPVAVIIGIDEYRRLLEDLDDAEDLAYLRKISSRELRFRKLDVSRRRSCQWS